MVVCIPVTGNGSVDPRWGRAERVVVASLDAGRIESWEEFDVGWDVLHDSGPEGGHHARIARFLRDHSVDVVTVDHMGPPMEHMLQKMGIRVLAHVSGNARNAIEGMLEPSGTLREPDLEA